MRVLLAGFMITILAVTAALAGSIDTPVQRRACQGDAMRLCFWYIPNKEQIISCMAANRSQLSEGCRKVFDAGMRDLGR